MPRKSNIRRRRRRAAVMYAAVLLIAMLLTGAGITLISTQMADRRMLRNVRQSEQGALLAQSGIEWALWSLNRNAAWRDTFADGQVLSLNITDLGSFDVTISDDDGDLADSDRDLVNLSVTAMANGTAYYAQTTAQPEITPFDVLKTCLHGVTEVQVHGGNRLTPIGAPLSCNGNVRNDEVIDGDVEAATLSGGGVILGTATVPAPAKDMPGGTVFDYYRDIATKITYFGNMVGQVLAPGYNPWGATNADGVYYIDTLGHDIDIQGSRIHGTLVVDCPGKTVFLKDAVFLSSYRADYPALIVNGKAEFVYESKAGVLSEADWGANLNPVGAEYEGSSDFDLADIYPSEIRGLVHVFDELSLKLTARVHGVVICEANAHVEGINEIEHDPSLVENPPVGYEQVGGLQVFAGSWR